MSNPTVSIIVPVYNGEFYLKHCLDSILHQKCSDFEVIIVNDGSTDNSLQICNSYSKLDSRFKVFSQPNEGVSSARNHGIEKASSRWITFVDADDWIESNFLCFDFDKDIDLILQNKKTFGDQILFESYQPGSYEDKFAIEFIRENMLGELLRAPWGKFFRRSIIIENNLSFLPQYRLGEDALFMLDYFKHCSRVEVASAASYMYRLEGDFVKKYTMSFNECASYIHDLMEKYHSLGLENLSYLSMNYTFYSGIILSHHNKQECKAWFELPEVNMIKKNISALLPLKTKIKYYLSQYV